MIRLSDERARQLGSILVGAFKTAPVEEIETVLGHLTIDWLTVPAGSPDRTTDWLHSLLVVESD